MNVSSSGAHPIPTRERLMASGTELFARRGVHHVTSHEIAAIAGVAAGTFYLHFRDKQSLYEQIVLDALGDLRQRVDASVACCGDPGERVRLRSEELLSFAEEKRDLVRILFGRNTELSDLGADALNSLIPWVEEELRLRLPGGEIEPEVAAQAIVGMWARVLTWWAESPGRVPRQTALQTLIKMQLSGFEESGG